MRVKFVLVNTLLVVLGVEGYVSLGARTRCGDRICEAAQYCNSLTGGCAPCEEICEDSHNQQPDQCWKECQDYLHDKLYVSRSEMHISADQSLKGSIATLQLLITVSLVVSCVVLVLLFMILMFLIRPSFCRSFRLPLHKKDAKLNLSSLNTVVPPSPSQKKKNVAKNNNNGKELKLDVTAVPPPPPPSATTTPGPAATPATTSTPLSSRHPAEDNTLEYAAYDNPALAPSPVPRQESSF